MEVGRSAATNPDVPAHRCEVCADPCDDSEAWAISLDGEVAHHSCLRDLGVCGTLIDARVRAEA